MLTIRLQRVGKKKQPVYRLIVSEKARDTQGKYLELLGTYAVGKENGFAPVKDRVIYWIGKGAQMSGTVHNLMLKAGLVKGRTERSVHISDRRRKEIAKKKEEAAKAA